ncbi:MAG TPA: DUF4382 domain-containing protein [Thermoplasmata archaeon]
MTTRRAFALAVAGLIVTVAVASLGAYSAGTIKIGVRATSLSWQHVNVVFSDIQVHRANAGNASGWISLPLSTPQIDLVGMGSVTQLLSLDRAPPGKYTQLRIVINSVSGVLADGTPVNVTVPDGELKTVTPFDLAGGGSVTITLNFDLANSIHGADGEWTFRPVLGSLDIS